MPSDDHERQFDLALIGRPRHRSHFHLEEALLLVVFDELLAVFVEHVAMVLAEQPQDGLSGADHRPQLRIGGELVPHEVDAADLNLGSLEDLDHDMGVAGVAPLEQRDRGQVVPLLRIEPLDLADGQPRPRGIRAVAGLQSGGVLDLLLPDGFPTLELDPGEQGHLPDAEGQGVLPAARGASRRKRYRTSENHLVPSRLLRSASTLS